MVTYRLFNFGPTRIVEYKGKGFTFTHNMSWETHNKDQADWIVAHYPKIDLVETKIEDKKRAKPKVVEKSSSEVAKNQLRKKSKKKSLKVSKKSKKRVSRKSLLIKENNNVKI